MRSLGLNSAKRYSAIKYSLALLEIAYQLILLFVFLASGLSVTLANYIYQVTGSAYLVVPLYLAAVFVLYAVLNLPLNLYHSFILEHQFGLTKQSLRGWFIDQIKSLAISYIISLIMLGAFYFILDKSPRMWWFIVSLFWILFSLVLARLTPIIIIPLFFKYKKLTEESLRNKIMALAEKMKVKILDVFEIDFSKKTLKANAAFVGVGKTRRVILADTLKDKYTPEEIEVILAHEFAHYSLKHLVKLVFFNSAITIAIFYFIFKTSGSFLGVFNLSSLSDIAALPVVLVYFIIFGVITQPLGAYLSRRFEKEADLLALETTGLKEAFISTMDKLATQNLSDRNPHPLIKMFFFDHPPIDERINMAKAFLESIVKVLY